MKWLEWHKFRNSHIYFTHDLPETATKRYKFSLLRISGYVVIYTFFSWLFLILILGITPLKNFLFVLDQEEFKSQKEKVVELKEKVEFLTAQLQTIATVNERMKYAMKLAQKDTLDYTSTLYDTLRSNINKKLKLGGNVFEAFQLLFEKIFEDTTSAFSLFFMEPVKGIITQQFYPDRGHFGIDYGLKIGTPVFAAASGFVVFADYTVDDGYLLIVQHERNYLTIYKHCSSLLKKVRDVVKQGELIALSGNSGKNTTGPHLHFEIWHNGRPIDPEKLLIK